MNPWLTAEIAVAVVVVIPTACKFSMCYPDSSDPIVRNAYFLVSDEAQNYFGENHGLNS